MPATTRSQTALEEKGITTSHQAPKGTKRKAPTSSSSKDSPAKRQKKQPTKTTSKPNKDVEEQPKTKDENQAIILINRAPVLELFSSTLTHFLHPSLSWSTCLSIGSAIGTITAISKGRSIGTISKPDPSTKKKKREATQENAEEISIMHFNLKLKSGSALVGEKPKKGNEEVLRKKFGGEGEYEKVKGVMEESLKGWEGREEELDQRAWGMYEDFRPSVAKGQKGWGRKGELDLGRLREVVGGW